MRHHFERAKHVYQDRGLFELAKATLGYIPIEANNAIFHMRHGTGSRVMEEDWDTLILLDACRYDMFERRVPFEGRLESRISLGSTSEEFLRRNFEDGQFHDTVYVNANVYFPKVGLDGDETFHAVIDLLDQWDEDLEIAHPETVTNAAKRAHEQHPNKRIVVHYMQPHIPFIGQNGRKITKKAGNRNAWVPFRSGNRPISIEELWKGYNENLDLVFNYVEQLSNEIEGKIVISADHGNMVGERQGPIPTKRLFGHPWGVYSQGLVKVPWFVMNGERRTVTSESPTTKQHTDSYKEELVDRRLRMLGYKN